MARKRVAKSVKKRVPKVEVEAPMDGEFAPVRKEMKCHNCGCLRSKYLNMRNGGKEDRVLLRYQCVRCGSTWYFPTTRDK